MDRVIPCSLHLMMGITRKLLKDIAGQIDCDANRTELIAKMKELFTSMKITLWSPKSPGPLDYFADVIKRSSLNRTQLLTIIENWKKMLAVLRDHGRSMTALDKVFVSI